MVISKSSTQLCVTIVFSLDLVAVILCHFDPVLNGHFRVVSSEQKLQHRNKAMSNHHCASEMIVS